MPFNLLIFPLAGGYYLWTRFHYFKFIQHKSDRQRLLFNSAIGGIILLIATYFLRIFFENFSPNIISKIWNILPIHEPYFGTSLFSFCFAVILTESVNLFTNAPKLILKAINRIGNEFELILAQSFTESDLIQVTLNNDKFYIGWVSSLPIPAQSSYIKIMPAFSGYRDEKKKLVFTTEYLGVYASFVADGIITDVEDLECEIVIKIDNILTANIFNIDVFDRFNSPSHKKPNKIKK